MSVNEQDKTKTGLYERSVFKVTELTKPYLHDVTDKFVEKAVDTYAKDNPRYARMIEFEVRRRGDGAGLTQDVAEPIIWVGVKTAAATAIAVLTKSLENGKVKLVGYATAIGLVLNNTVDLLRVIPRYKAGLQGSLEMARERWKSIEASGVDPFNQQSREINLPEKAHPKFTESVQKKAPVSPTSLTEQALETGDKGFQGPLR